ncbi:thioesterase II family protein [Streptomyces sp. NPDC059788]|uniref:thioesterase II family protein n=1 Tax=Streptomyces sp. NPDC059788 TaxID=3346948 RepID=UPI0036595AC9
MRLFVLHHAGGSHVPYRNWAAYLPPDWELCLTEAPGRGHRYASPLCRTAGELAEVWLEDLRPWTECPFALFGHSMGGIAAFELSHLLRDRSLPLPRWVGISGVRPPEFHIRSRQRHDLPAARLRQAVLEMGGTPPDVLADPGLWRLLEPVLRADLALAERWRPTDGARALPVPMTVFAGDRDAGVPTGELRGWEAYSTRFSGVQVLPGGHFYFQSDPAALVSRAVRELVTATAPRP